MARRSDFLHGVYDQSAWADADVPEFFLKSLWGGGDEVNGQSRNVHWRALMIGWLSRTYASEVSVVKFFFPLLTKIQPYSDLQSGYSFKIFFQRYFFFQGVLLFQEVKTIPEDKLIQIKSTASRSRLISH